MYRILKKGELTTNIYLMDVEAKRVAKSCLPGQFLIVRADEEGERIPLTICDYDREAGTVTIVFQCVGAATQMMAELKVGDSFHDVVGPLGCASELTKEPIEELKKKLAFLLEHHEVVENYKACSSPFICGKYHWENVVDKTIEVYKSPNRKGYRRSHESIDGK